MNSGLLLRNRKISVPFELEQVEFRIFTPGIPLPKISRKEFGPINISSKIFYLNLSAQYDSIHHQLT